jgi:TonB-dependent receptor-like protein
MIARQRPMRAGRLIVVTMALAMCVCLPLVLAQPRDDAFTGRRLDDALRILQARGLPLVFSSVLVTPDMRVHAEPRAKAARDQLVELLESHDLMAESGPAGVIQVVRKKRPAREQTRPQTPPARSKERADRNDASALGTVYNEEVTVTPIPRRRGDVSVGSEKTIGSHELREIGSHITDDPLRVVQAMPGVAAGDDFRSEYSVRGSPYRHAGVVVDGVIAPWLQHAAVGRGDTGTMTMLRSDMVQEATLLVGAYPRRDGVQLGPQLNLTLREGSRTARRFLLGVSGTTTTLTAEGPLGPAARGSWLVGLRKSHVEWPVGHQDDQSTVFGFGDLQSKFVYDARPGQEISLSVVAGLSNVEREDPNPFALSDGINRAAMVSMAWTSVIGSRTIVTQQISSLTHQFLNRDQTNQPASRGSNGAEAYRLAVTRSAFKGVVEAGGQMRRVHGSRHGPTWLGSDWEGTSVDRIDATWLERSAHLSFRRSVGSRVMLDGGFRFADSTLTDEHVVDRWVRAEWTAGPTWLLHGSTGVMHQLPTLEQNRGRTGAAHVRPESATHADLGIGQRLSASVRWDATLFVRTERDALREPGVHPRLLGGVLVEDGIAERFENALTGSARGIELSIWRRNHAGFSGWAGYSYGVARYDDAARHETFPADFDQRHAINASGVVPGPWGTRMGLTFRGGTNFPIPGYLALRDGQLFAGDERNQVRLPAYARLDLRAERTFDHIGRRFTLFAEAINVLNRVNVGLADGAITRDTSEARGFTERLFPRLVTAGVRLEL